jgi:hypothetical protein
VLKTLLGVLGAAEGVLGSFAGVLMTISCVEDGVVSAIPQYGTYKTVKARFWPRCSGTSA